MERDEEIIVDRAGTPMAKVAPLVRRANRTAIGSLAGQLDLSGDLDSSETNAEIAADFGILIWETASDLRILGGPDKSE